MNSTTAIGIAFEEWFYCHTLYYYSHLKEEDQKVVRNMAANAGKPILKNMDTPDISLFDNAWELVEYGVSYASLLEAALAKCPNLALYQTNGVVYLHNN